MHNPFAASIPASHSYLFLSAFASPQAAMCTTLRAENKRRNRAHGVGQAAAVVSSSTNEALRDADPWHRSPDDKRIPIAPPDTVSMECEGAGIAQPQWVIQKQPMVDALDMLIIRAVKRAMGELGRLNKQCIAFFFSHSGIVRCMRGMSHSYFSVVYFVHGCTLAPAAQQRNIEITPVSRCRA